MILKRKINRRPFFDFLTHIHIWRNTLMKKAAVISAAALLALSVSLTSCGKEKTADKVKNYTYHSTMTIPKTFSPTDWQLHDEGVCIDLMRSPLYEFIPNESRDSYEIVTELASKMPVDVTKEYAGNEKYGVPADATEGYAWKVEMRKDAVWDNGDPIDVSDVEYSFKQYLNPDMKNFRASNYYGDSLPLVNAKDYYNGAIAYDDIKTADGYRDVADSDMWTSLSVPVMFFEDTAESYGGESKYADYWKDGEKDMWARLVEISGGHTYFKLTDEVKDIYNKVSAAFGDKRAEAYKEWCFSRTEKEATKWEDVGFIKNDDYTFTVVLTKGLTDFMFKYTIRDFSLIREDLYEANKKAAGDIVKSSYGTSKEKMASYGPYKISEFQADKSIKFERNENWYGYKDGQHEGLFQTSAVDYQFLTDHNTILNLFLQGELDATALTVTDMDKYGNSEYRIDTPRSYTWKLSFNIDRKALQKENSTGVNHSIIANKNFRHAVSLSIDRQKWIETVAPTSEVAFGLINNSYIAVPESGLRYRDTPEAKAALVKFYGVANADEITGYDLVTSKKYFQQAYDEEIASGELLPTDKIQIDLHAYSQNESTQRRVTCLQDSINKATEGTSLEGKITVKLVVDQNYYDNMKTGSVDLALTAWGGSSFDPYGILWCYATKDAKNEYGFDPFKETCTVNIDGKDVTKSFNEWYEELCNGEYVTAPVDVKNAILAANEGALLSYYNMIPLEYDCVSGLLSQRVVEYCDHYINEDVEFGKIRYRTYTMDDDEWTAYCKEQNNQLKY